MMYDMVPSRVPICSYPIFTDYIVYYHEFMVYMCWAITAYKETQCCLYVNKSELYILRNIKQTSNIRNFIILLVEWLQFLVSVHEEQ